MRRTSAGALGLREVDGDASACCGWRRGNRPASGTARPRRAGTAAPRRACRRPVRPLDLDDLGAQIAEHLRRPRGRPARATDRARASRSTARPPSASFTPSARRRTRLHPVSSSTPVPVRFQAFEVGISLYPRNAVSDLHRSAAAPGKDDGRPSPRHRGACASRRAAGASIA